VHQPTTTPEPAALPDAPSRGSAEVPIATGPPLQPTGPVDFVPGPPGVGAPPPPVATAPRPRKSERKSERKGERTRARRDAREARAPRITRTPRQRASLAGAGLATVSLLLLEVGLALDLGDGRLWSAVPLWSAFATLGALLGLLPFAGRVIPGVRVRPDGAWRVAAAGLTGLAVFWVLVVLPEVASNRGFVLTAALAALGAALWIAPVRRR
jgi:hypothetical protein